MSNIEIENGFQLSKLERIDADALIDVLLLQVGKAFKMSGSDDDTLVEMTVQQLMADPYRKLDAIIKAIDNGLSGKYGKLYGKLNYFQLQEWLTKFDEETTYERESMHSSELRPRWAEEKTSPVKVGVMTDQQKDLIKKIDSGKA